MFRLPHRYEAHKCFHVFSWNTSMGFTRNSCIRIFIRVSSQNSCIDSPRSFSTGSSHIIFKDFQGIVSDISNRILQGFVPRIFYREFWTSTDSIQNSSWASCEKMYLLGICHWILPRISPGFIGISSGDCFLDFFFQNYTKDTYTMFSEELFEILLETIHVFYLIFMLDNFRFILRIIIGIYLGISSKSSSGILP